MISFTIESYLASGSTFDPAESHKQRRDDLAKTIHFLLMAKGSTARIARFQY